MITDPKQDGDTRGAPPDRLRTAAWLQYLIDRLDDAAGTALIDACPRAGLSRDARAALHELAPWLATDGSGCGCARDDACTHVPDAQQLAHAERCCPGSRAVYDSAHGVVDAWSFDDRETGWAALERIAEGVGNSDETAAHDAGHERGRAAVPPAKHLAEQRIAVAVAGAQPSTRPGALIDAVVLRICGPRDDASRIDEMAALATFCAALAAGDAISIAAYGGAHNLVARAIRTRRADLASVDGLLASLSVCRLERLLGAGSFWAYYLLAGVAIAAPGVVHAFGRRFHGDAWREWLDAVLASPAVSRFGPQEDAAFERLRGAMSLTSRRNPIVRAKRLRTRAVAIAPFGRDGVGRD